MVTVSYIAIGGYAAFVVISSLLVGILPPLVNRPYCDEKTTPSLRNADDEYIIKPSHPLVAEENENVVPALKLAEENHSKKISKRDTSRNVIERTDAFRQSHADFLSQRGDLLKNKAYNLSICQEITNPQPGVRYPWYESRLPKSLVPTNYDLELFVPTFTSEIYDGKITITFTVLNSTNFIILHSKLELPFVDGWYF